VGLGLVIGERKSGSHQNAGPIALENATESVIHEIQIRIGITSVKARNVFWSKV
jgi:hypothetical protein